jgi:lysophospholipase L1-like esterase
MYLNEIKKILALTVMMSTLLILPLYASKTVHIMPLGDSITEGGYYLHSKDTEKNKFIAYRAMLWSKLHDANYSVDFVGSKSGGKDYKDYNDTTFDMDHEGHNGWKADEIDGIIDTSLTTNPADVVLLHVGTNDLVQKYDIESTVTDITNILDKIKAHNTHTTVVVARIINRMTYNQETTDFNVALNTMVQSRITNGDDIILVDMENGADINYSTDMVPDTPSLGGLHPNETGYTKMADLWLSALKTVIPTHKWTLDEDNTASFVDIYRDTNGTCATSCPTRTAGRIGYAQQFDGTNDINISDSSTFNWAVSDSFTISFWMKTDVSDLNINGTTQNNVMLGRGDGTRMSWFIGIDGNGAGGHQTNRINFGLYDSNDSTTNTQLLLTGTTPIVDATWHHIVCVRDASNNKNMIYVDGNLSAETTIMYDASFDEGTTPVSIGWLNWRYPPSVGEKFYYEGDLDDITVFDGALSQAQIKRLYQDTQTPLMSITTNPVTSAQLNTPYIYDVNSSNDPYVTFDWINGISPVSWLSINGDGEIIGVPNAVVNIDVNITATDGNQTATQNYVLKVRNPASLPSDIRYYWELDEANGSVNYFESYQGADGMCAAADCPSQATTAKVGNAQTFDGTKKIDVTDSEGFNFPKDSSLTIEFWMKTNTNTVDVNGTTQNNVMLGRGNGSRMSWFVGINGGPIRFGLFDSNDAVTNTQLLDSNVHISDNSWHHIVCVRDASNNKNIIYVDGNLSAEKNVTYDAGFDEGATPMNIGWLNWIFNGEKFYYDGQLDEIAIFNVALTPTEIQTHYNNGLAGKGFADTTVPVITLTGANPQQLTVGTPYTELGATANDNVDGDISANIIIDATAVDTAAEGNYTVTYDVNDTAGNAAVQVSRTVEVVAATDWYEISDDNKTVTITEGSKIVAEDENATVTPDLTAEKITLSVENVNGCTAYAEASKDGTIITGYKGNCPNVEDTLQDGTAFPLGTESVIKSEGTSIESTVKLNKDESFVIGGK